MAMTVLGMKMARKLGVMGWEEFLRRTATKVRPAEGICAISQRSSRIENTLLLCLQFRKLHRVCRLGR
jgi:hypothetical protein